MFEDMDNLKIISSTQGFSKSSVKMREKKLNSFIFRTCGVGQFDFGGNVITVRPREMIFLPAGTTYEFKVLEEKCGYTSINFEADLKNPEPTVYSLENFSETEYICSHFPDLWSLGSQSEKYQCMSVIYSLLAFISNSEHLDYSQKRKLGIIDPAVEYLKKHIYDSSLKVDNLHVMCGISDTYFRKIFISKFGISTQKYIVSKRLSKAKTIIETGHFDSITEISETVGYNDPLHFSRAFKKKYGLSPSNIKKES